MTRVIVLDSGPLGLACADRRRDRDHVVSRLTYWWITARANGALIVIPEIADYEVRRSLILNGGQDSASIRRLDGLLKELTYAPITTAAIRRAAGLWAEVRRGPAALPTADEKALDADVILAAQALLYVGHGDELVVATGNARHLSRFLDARDWWAITP